MSAALDALRRRYSGREPGLLGARREYAVLCPVLEQPDGLHLLFEVRAPHLRQGGEVCFPGGRKEADESFIDCALRETEEELSIPRKEIQLLGTPDFLCSSGGFLVRPILGLVSEAGLAGMEPSSSEVSEVFSVPLAFFKNTEPELYGYDLLPRVQEDFPYERVGIDESYPWARSHVEVPVWYWQNHVIWGMTARIVRNLIQE